MCELCVTFGCSLIVFLVIVSSSICLEHPVYICRVTHLQVVLLPFTSYSSNKRSAVINRLFYSFVIHPVICLSVHPPIKPPIWNPPIHSPLCIQHRSTKPLPWSINIQPFMEKTVRLQFIHMHAFNKRCRVWINRLLLLRRLPSQKSSSFLPDSRSPWVSCLYPPPLAARQHLPVMPTSHRHPFFFFFVYAPSGITKAVYPSRLPNVMLQHRTLPVCQWNSHSSPRIPMH